jgi:hypothetical protein
MTFEFPEDAAGLGRREDLVEHSRGMGAESIQDPPEPFRLSNMDLDQRSHAVGKLAWGPLGGHRQIRRP